MPQKVAFFGHNMCKLYHNGNGIFLGKSPLPKNWYFLDLVCLVQVVTIITGSSYIIRSRLKKFHILDLVCSVQVWTITNRFSYRKRCRLKKWHFIDLVCSLHVVTITTGLCYCDRSHLKKWHYLDLVYSAYVVTITTGLNYSKKELPLKVEFFGPSMLNTCIKHYNLVLLK